MKMNTAMQAHSTTVDIKSDQVWRLVVAVMACILILHSPLIFNPGYLSHDELQWAYFATEHQGPAFINGLWGDVHAFQYRPLTFSLWMLISRHCFDHPFVFHAIVVAASALNAGMLSAVLLRAGAHRRIAMLGGLLFGLGPYAAYTHGWVATIADLLWVFCTLAIALIIMKAKHRRLRWPASLVLTAVALLAKESAIVIPALLLLAWLFSARQRTWLEAALSAAVPVAVYLAVRLHTILTGAPAPDSPYNWHLSVIPLNWIKYQLYPIAIDKFSSEGVRVLVPILLVWGLLMLALWRAHVRYVLAFVLFGTVALGPVLIVQSAAWYGYAFSAATAGVIALAWPHMNRWSHLAVSLFALLGFLHSINLMRIIHDAGEKQSRFSPALAQAVKDAGGREVLLSVKNEKDRWIYIRMTHDIHAYAGVKMDGLVKLVEDTDPSDCQILEDGSLKRLP
jgi:hypothetical protein